MEIENLPIEYSAQAVGANLSPQMTVQSMVKLPLECIEHGKTR